MFNFFNSLIQAPKGRFALFLGIAVIIIGGVALYAFDGRYVPNREIAMESSSVEAGGFPIPICSTGKLRACVDFISQKGKLMTFLGHGVNSKNNKPIIKYEWGIKYNSQGRRHLLSKEESFFTDSISEGIHTIYFRVGIKGDWSKWVSKEFTVSAPLPPSITVVSPNGEEKWEVGKNYDIQWKTVGTSLDTHWVVRLFLVDTAGQATDLFPSFAVLNNDGSEIWSIPAAITPGTYKIRAQLASAKSGQIYYDESDNFFSIVGASATPFITILSPNGGEQWEIGKTYIVKWNLSSDPLNGDYKTTLTLKRDSDPSYNYNIINPDVPIQSSGTLYSYNWTVYSWMGPTGTLPANDYRIEVTMNGGGIGGIGFFGDQSDAPFTIALWRNKP